MRLLQNSWYAKHAIAVWLGRSYADKQAVCCIFSLHTIWWYPLAVQGML